MRSLSVGIIVHNEAAAIGELLNSVCAQTDAGARILEVIVVSSGSTDGTDDIVVDKMRRDPRIALLRQTERRGKASAINVFLALARGDIVIVSSGDILPESDAIAKLVAPFADPSTGMTGGRPVPVNRDDTFIGYAVHLMWQLHHHIAQESPKLGEMVAFRNIIRSIPEDTAVDEAVLEALIVGAGYELRYVQDAIIHNKGPETLADFIRQRRRIAAGHMHLSRTKGYAVSTSSPFRILQAVWGQPSLSPRRFLWTAGVIALEAAGRALGWYDFLIRKKNPYIWDIARTTKRLS